MTSLSSRDSDYFFDLQTRTGWGRTLEKFARWIDPPSGSRVLDVGCGPGLFPAILERRGCRACGVDLDPASFRPPRLHACLGAADALRLPFPPAAFDLVTASNLLFLLPDPRAALDEMLRVLSPEGRLALLNPAPALTPQSAADFARQRGLDELGRSTLVNWARRAVRHHRWDAPALADFLAASGVQLERSKPAVGPGFALWALARPLP